VSRTLADESYVRVELTACSGRTIEGRVVWERDGAPVEQAEVQVGAGDRGGTVRTDREGRFTVRGLPSEEPAWITAFAHRAEDRLDPLVGPGPYTLKLPSPPRVRGTAVDELHRPLERFEVNKDKQDSPDGRFEVDLPSDATEVVLAAKGRRTVHRPAPTGGEVLYLGEVVLDRSGVVHLHAVGADGRPVAGAEVRVGKPIAHHLHWWDLESPSVARTGADGQADVAVEPGHYCFLATAANQVPRPELPCDVEVGPEGAEVALTLAPAAWVSGQVLDHGAPVPFVALRVGLSTETTFTDAQGHYRLGPLLPDRVLVTCFADAAAKQPRSMKVVELKQGEEAKLDFGAVPATAEVEVTVRARPEDQAVEVAATPGDHHDNFRPVGMWEVHAPVVDGRATARLQGLEAGTYFIIARAEHPMGQYNYASTFATIELSEGQHASLQLELKR
jgi:hypothetical protein